MPSPPPTLPDPELISWSQTIQLVGDRSIVYEQVSYGANVSPILVAQAALLRVLSISGSAEVWWGKLKPPPPALSSYLLARPQFDYVNLTEQNLLPSWRTSWQYLVAVDDAQWPGDNQFNAFVEAAADWPDVATLAFLPAIP